MAHVHESTPVKDVPKAAKSAKPAVQGGGIAGLQRAIGNRATVGLLSDVDGDLEGSQAQNPAALIGRSRDGGRGSGAPTTVQRLFGFGSKDKKPETPKVTPELARDIQNAIAKSAEMKKAEELRALGTEAGENQALELIEKYWDTGEVEAGGKKVALKDFKPLMFTPSERRVRQINKVRLASSTKAGFDKSVQTGRTAPTNTPYKAPTDKKLPPGVGAVKSVGDAGGTTSQVSGYGTDVGSHFQDPTQGSGMSESAKLLDTKYNNPNDPMYGGPPSFESKSDWAGSIIEIVQGAFGIVSAVADFVKKASDKDASKTETAEAGASAGATLSTAAGSVSEMVQNIQGSDLTTNMFHWVPGLSVLSNGLSAVKSALALVPRAVQLHSLRTNGQKVKSDAQREDVKLATSRLAVRAAQQVEQESFAVAKSLTNAGLSLAEVVTAGGFGIPRLATVVVDGVGVLHSIGHAIADFIRANASGKARTDYFGAHKEKSAENLLNTDPSFAADAILTRATEADPEAIAILKAYDIEVPPIGGMNLVKLIKVDLPGGKGTEQQMQYNYDAIEKYDAAKAKLIEAIKPEKTVGETVDQVTSVLTERTQGLDTAKRLAAIRNEIGYKNKKDRGVGFKIAGFFKGNSGQQKSVDKTENAIRNDPKIAPADKERLIKKLRGTEETAPPKPGGDPNIGKPVDQATFAKAMKMSQGEVYQVILGGAKGVGGPGPVWEAYLAAYVAKG